MHRAGLKVAGRAGGFTRARGPGRARLTRRFLLLIFTPGMRRWSYPACVDVILAKGAKDARAPRRRYIRCPHILKALASLTSLAPLARRSYDGCLNKAIFSQPLPEKTFFHIPGSLRPSLRSLRGPRLRLPEQGRFPRDNNIKPFFVAVRSAGPRSRTRRAGTGQRRRRPGRR